MKIVRILFLSLTILSAPAAPAFAQPDDPLEQCLADCDGMFPPPSWDNFTCRKDCRDFYGHLTAQPVSQLLAKLD
ncbi:hypothetical protein [Sphingomonas sp. KR3-1]|uniref:hypothetical protein n=1 Tax=Sphingomonas sp. KR3-1 TaxID=3156611 RepID=UPI0032B5ED94